MGRDGGLVERVAKMEPDVDPDMWRKALAVCRDVNGHREAPLGWLLMPCEGWRSPERQALLVKAGRSKLKRSKHNVVKGGKPAARAVDVAWYHPVRGWSWENRFPWALVGRSARAHGLRWGGDWRTFVDRPHLELPGW